MENFVFYLTADTDDVIRIEAESGGSITLGIQKGVGYIRYIDVPEDMRKKGLGSGLLAAAEAELYERGIDEIQADFLDQFVDGKILFESGGYIINEAAPVLSIDLGTLLEAKAVRKALRADIPGAYYSPLEDLFVAQLDELINIFRRLSMPISQDDLDVFSDMDSGVVYDEMLKPKAFIFCSQVSGDLYVDFLGGTTKSKPQFIMVAVRGMLTSLMESGREGMFRNLVLLAADKNVNLLLRKALGRETTPSLIQKTYCANKKLTKPSVEPPIQGYFENNAPLQYLNDQMAEIPLQRNVSWKAAYVRRGR